MGLKPDEKAKLVFTHDEMERFSPFLATDATLDKQAQDFAKKILFQTVNALSLMLAERDPYTYHHQERMAKIAEAIAIEIGLSEAKVSIIKMAAKVHDIGKIRIPIEILCKSGQIDEFEFGIIKTHPQVGFDILNNIEFPWPIAQIVLQHHERLNGSGYPHGLRGEHILLEARVLAVADVVEAMASHRPYRPALGVAAALNEISQNRDVLYDALAVDGCMNLSRKMDFANEDSYFA